MVNFNGEATVVDLHNWADSTMQERIRQGKAHWRKQQRREGMAPLRTYRTGEHQSMQQERTQLELQYKQHLALSIRAATESNESELSQAMNRIVLESDALRTENIELLERLQQHKRLHSLRQQGLSRRSTLTPSPSKHWTFWEENPPSSNLTSEYDSVVTHARFTIRRACSLDEMNKTILETRVAALPLIMTLPNWNRDQRDQVRTQVLQEIEKGAGYVMACNIPGPGHQR
ncbi:hypothetical protein JG687_00014293 [Phytophthora cactorum]|uniref:Uncharacterized protein n=1 Tax=Phytophthora cactorum TaxID=29920 RepID=A0A8T1U1Z2_9STRA|nr:hypothetical protein JG687_00014293 [Phytophthora cactorum]